MADCIRTCASAKARDDDINDYENPPSVSNFLTIVNIWIFWISVATTITFVLLALVRGAYLIRLRRVGVANARAFATLLATKVFAGLAITTIRLGLLVVIVQGDGATWLVASSALELAAAVLLLIISSLNHIKQFRPSVLSCSFLFLAFLFDLTRCPAAWRATKRNMEHTGHPGEDAESPVSAVLLTVNIVFEFLFLGLESTGRRRWIRWRDKATNRIETWRNHSPEEVSSIISLASYWWLLALLWRGYQKPLTMDCLYALDRSISSQNFGSAEGLSSSETQAPSPKPSSSGQETSSWRIILWLWKPLSTSVILPVFPRLCLICFTFSQTFFLQSLLRYLSESKDDESSPDEHATGFALVAGFIYSGIAISTGLYWYYQERFQSLLRAFLISAIYRKTTELEIGTVESNAPVTLMGADVERIYTGVRLAHEVWANAIQIALAAWLLQGVLGPAAFAAPLAVVLAGFGGSLALSARAPRRQAAWMARVQSRTEATSSVLGRLRDLRVSGMTAPAAGLVKGEREREVEVGDRSRALIAASAGLSQLPQAVAPALAFAFGPRALDETRAYTALAYLTLLTAPMLVMLQSLPILASCVASLRRIKLFVDQEPRANSVRDKTERCPSSVPDVATGDEGESIVVRDGSFGWTDEAFVLHSINLRLRKSSITFVVGPVASGKSTLCMALLGEVPHAKGRVTLNAGRLGFCSQVPFLWNESVRDNIVGFASFDTDRYNDVLQATILGEDLDSLPAGDRTVVGSKGLSLSGGQRQRVSLARALYQRADILVLDDVFSGLDGSTQQRVCQAVFGPSGLLRKRGTTAIICTHSTDFLSVADHIVVLTSDGRIAQQGGFAQIVQDKSRAQQFGIYGPGYSRNEHTSEVDDSEGFDVGTGEQDTIAAKATPTNLKMPRSLTPSPAVDMDVYRHWLRTIGPLPVLIYFALVVGIGFCANFPTVWLAFWSSDSTLPPSQQKHSFAFWMGIYFLLGAGSVICVFPAGSIMLRTATRLAGTNLHHSAVDTIMHSSLRFLSTTDVGRVLNLFSQDMNIIDTQLPRMTNNMCFCLATAVGQAAVISWSSPWLTLSYPVFVTILWAVQRVYMPTSKQLRLLDLEAKTPLYTHFLDTLAGLPTMRAFGWVPQQVVRNNALLDDSQRPLYLLAMAQQWLALTMNVLVAVASVILVALATRLGSSAGNVGAGLISIITLSNTLTTIVVAYTGLETSLGAISRLRSFQEETEREDQDPQTENYIPEMAWPVAGRVQLENVEASYDALGEEKVLKGISLTVEPGEKLAICGRTGSGKSTVLALLSRLVDPLDTAPGGAAARPVLVAIDGTPLRAVDRAAARERVVAVPQDSVFLPPAAGPPRWASLDPWAAASDAECAAALRDVHPGLPSALGAGEGGLDGPAGEGSQLSAGQKQLFCLARAVLRRRVKLRRTGVDGGLLLLDEITSSADEETELLVRNLLNGEFAAYTVIMVTHRRAMALACDRVVVMDSGRVVEDGRPAELLQRQRGWFKALWASNELSR